MYGGVINKIGFFKDKDSTFISVVVPLLQPLHCNAKDILYKKGDYPAASIFQRFYNFRKYFS